MSECKCENCTEWEYFEGYGYGCFCMKTMTPIDAEKCEFYADKRLVKYRTLGNHQKSRKEQGMIDEKCWECSDFNIKNTIGEECEGNRHIFCDKSLEKYNKQIKEKERAKTIGKTLKIICKEMALLEERLSTETNEGRWVDEEKCQFAIQQLEFLMQRIKEIENEND